MKGEVVTRQGVVPAQSSELLPSPPNTFYVRRGKRIFDVTVGTALLVLTSPIQVSIALMIRRKLGRPVIFSQPRPGLGSEPFQIIKFRTMTDQRDSEGNLLPDELRLTAFGQFLRSTSLDELPELVNVVRGELSIVGPRPLLTKYLKRYSPRQLQRQAIRPGITGLAQVMGRNTLSWEEKFEFDLNYLENISLKLDLRIIMKTIVNVLSRKDISAADHATMPEFLGDAA